MSALAREILRHVQLDGLVELRLGRRFDGVTAAVADLGPDPDAAVIHDILAGSPDLVRHGSLGPGAVAQAIRSARRTLSGLDAAWSVRARTLREWAEEARGADHIDIAATLTDAADTIDDSRRGA